MPIKSQRALKKRATQAERAVANDLGGRKTFASGSRDEKADVTVAHKVTMNDGILRETTLFSFRVEVKTTRSDGYTLSSQDWQGVLHAAEKAGQAPVFVMEIGVGSPGTVKFAVIPSNFFSELTGWSSVPLAQKDVGKKSLRVKRLVRTDGWGAENTPVRRIWLSLDTPGKRGDVCILDYYDFLRLVKAAEEKHA